jgi:hypothetical protein
MGRRERHEEGSRHKGMRPQHEVIAGERSCLEWRASAFSGMVIEGVTVRTRDAAGRIVRAAIDHRPLGSLKRARVGEGSR